MTREEMVNTLREFIDALDDCDMVALHNEYCECNFDCDNRIYDMWDFDDIMNGTEPFEIARMCWYGSFNPNDPYFIFNGYGNLESLTTYEIYEHIDVDDIVAYIVTTDDELYNDDIRKILNSIDEDEE